MYKLIVCDGDLTMFPHNGRFDNGYGYILSWAIIPSNENINIPNLIYTSPLFNPIPRYIVLRDSYITGNYDAIYGGEIYRGTNIFFTDFDDYHYLLIDTQSKYTYNPVIEDETVMQMMMDRLNNG